MKNKNNNRSGPPSAHELFVESVDIAPLAFLVRYRSHGGKDVHEVVMTRERLEREGLAGTRLWSAEGIRARVLELLGQTSTTEETK